MILSNFNIKNGMLLDLGIENYLSNFGVDDEHIEVDFEKKKQKAANEYLGDTLDIPEGVTSIKGPLIPIEGRGDSVYGFKLTPRDETGLVNPIKHINIPDGVESIGNNAFLSFSNATDVRIPESLRGIGVGAFANCRKLDSIDVQNVEVIGRNAFRGCARLSQVEGTPKNIGARAFMHCRRLENIDLSNSEFIGISAFEDCRSLKSPELSDNLKTIEDQAFANCKGITSLTVPDSVKYVGSGALDGCTGLKSLTVGPNTYFDSGISGDTYGALNSLTVNGVTFGPNNLRVLNPPDDVSGYENFDINAVSKTISAFKAMDASRDYSGLKEFAPIPLELPDMVQERYDAMSPTYEVVRVMKQNGSPSAGMYAQMYGSDMVPPGASQNYSNQFENEADDFGTDYFADFEC